MSCTAIIRGNTVVFTATFYDASGAIANPVGATVRVAYNHASTPTIDTLTMSVIGTTWTAEWDSTQADAGVIEWHAASDGTPSSADDGSFTLSANTANPES